MRNTRIIAGIIAFIGTFAVSVGLVWLLFGFPVKPTYSYSRHNCQQKQQHTNAIYSFLQRDINNGRDRDRRSFNDFSEESYSIATHADSVSQYVEESGSMDVSGFPRDFQIAWNKHMDAWQNYAEFLNAKKNSSKRLTKEDFQNFDERYTDEINETWYEVLRIGKNHGAYIR